MSVHLSVCLSVCHFWRVVGGALPRETGRVDKKEEGNGVGGWGEFYDGMPGWT